MDPTRNQAGKSPDSRKIDMTIAARLPLFIVLALGILFLSAGRVDIPRAWVFVVTYCVYVPISMLIVYKRNPELIRQRARGIRRDTKTWDKALMPAIVVMVYVQLAVIGMDVGRFQWSSLGIEYGILGLLLFAAAAVFASWAVLSNPYYEPTVRIQKERGHHVITGGPYRIVRHPGYLAGIVIAVATPMIIGSAIGLIPAGISLLLIVTRTVLEDRTLQKELLGYAQYAGTVKYRLFPGIW